MSFPRQKRSRGNRGKTQPDDPDRNIRAFFAIDFDAPVKKVLREIQDLLKPRFSGYRVNWVNPAQIHLTLRFLGNISQEQLDGIPGHCSFTGFCRPLTVGIAGFGCFPSCEDPRVIWAGCLCPDDLFVLQKKLEDAARTAGMEPEKKRFSPHLTLGRVRDFTPRNNPATAIDAKEIGREISEICGGITQNVTHIRLYRSFLSPQGPEYKVLHEFSFSE